MIDNELWRYGELDRLERFWKPEQLIGKRLGKYTKRDGSCITRWHGLLNEMDYISTRKNAMAVNDLTNVMKRSAEYNNTESLLNDYKGLRIFGELIKTGKSPAQFEVNDKEEYFVFDMAHDKYIIEGNPKGFMPVDAAYVLAGQYNLPTCPLLETYIAKDLDDLFAWNDRLVTQSQELKLEGYVIKTLDGMHRWKVKSDLTLKTTLNETDKPVDPRPILPDSEAFGAVEKARNELGDASFVNVKLAMPLVSQYIQTEELKHGCQRPRANYFYYYTTRVKQI